MLHEIKIETPFFQAVLDRKKNFEVRYNDRGYQTGDTVVLNEWDKTTLYTGRRLEAEIGYVTNSFQQTGFVVFSLLMPSG